MIKKQGAPLDVRDSSLCITIDKGWKNKYKNNRELFDPVEDFTLLFSVSFFPP